MTDTEDLMNAAQSCCGTAISASGGVSPDAAFILIIALKYISEMMGLSHDEAKEKLMASWDNTSGITLVRRVVQQ